MSPSRLSKPRKLTCLSCRNKHVKCDGSVPACTRCLRGNNVCSYVKSRRGYNGLNGVWSDPVTDASVDGWSASLTSTALERQSMVDNDLTLEPDSITTHDQTSDSCHDSFTDETSIDLYYQTIHPAHPFMIPQQLYLQDPSVLPNSLKHMMTLLTKCKDSDLLHPAPSVESLRSTNGDDSDGGLKVQFLILQALFRFARLETLQGQRAIQLALELTLEIGLHRDDFATSATPVWQESWRRTWWELHHLRVFTTFATGVGVPDNDIGRQQVPGPCGSYNACQPLLPQPLESMQDRMIFGPAVEWYPFAYRIEATMLLFDVLRLRSSKNQHKSAATDTARMRISTFLLSLPTARAWGIDDDGETDEIMFGAIMTAHIANICLYMSSATAVASRKAIPSCNAIHQDSCTDDANVESLTAIRSAQAITKLLSRRSSFEKLDPCFVCIIGLCGTIQLRGCTGLKERSEIDHWKSTISFYLSILYSLSRRWPIAESVRIQLSRYARGVFLPPKMVLDGDAISTISSMENTGSVSDDHLWLSRFLQEGFDAFAFYEDHVTSL